MCRPVVQRQRDAGDVAVPGSPILTLISTKELWISAWVDETEMTRLKVDQPSRVRKATTRRADGRDPHSAISTRLQHASRERDLPRLIAMTRMT